ncbi:MAG: response regulator transcription factor [Myxococcales bacterium]|nr:response regulator transcription factor [Myxococcales bacterium]MCB9629019.1 response regulator transcription factor [Sandaracinaceae bacterium]
MPDAESPKRLLVVEDEAHLAAGLKLNLELDGYLVDVAGNAKQAAEKLIRVDRYDAIVLDVMLPDVNGFELCQRLRDSGNFVPVIMLTARSSPDDRVQGLEAGADDYMVKPFELAELLARVRSLLRRRKWETDRGLRPADTATLQFGNVRVDFDTHEVSIGGDESVKLTQLELDLLRYFSDNPGRVLSRDELLENVWKLRNYNNTRTIDNFISRLRRRFEPDGKNPVHFLSIRGAGYKFVPEP